MTPINKFAVFSYNYPHKFIEDCWKDSEWLVKHLREKFSGYYEKHGSLGVMTAFYMGLDGTNREKLEAYIESCKL